MSHSQELYIWLFIVLVAVVCFPVGYIAGKGGKRK